MGYPPPPGSLRVQNLPIPRVLLMSDRGHQAAYFRTSNSALSAQLVSQEQPMLMNEKQSAKGGEGAVRRADTQQDCSLPGA